jgi:hydroxymethylbilane synthase
MTPPRHIRLGTRGSELALAQADLTTAALSQAFPDLAVQRVVIHTTGDRRQDVKLTEFHQATGLPLDKGAFTKELEVALHAGEIDVAVHSLKDVPTQLDESFLLAATLPRAAREDVLFTKGGSGWKALPEGGVLLTSSPRRHFFSRWLRPDIRIEPIRGNVPTRLRKFLADDRADAMILAKAGLDRLGFHFPSPETMAFDETLIPCRILPVEEFLPAVGQGAVGLEIRRQDHATAHILSAINHAETYHAAMAEREFLRLLQAGCHTPVGVNCRITGNRMSMTALVFSENDPTAPPARAEHSGHPEEWREVACRLHASLSAG